MEESQSMECDPDGAAQLRLSGVGCPDPDGTYSRITADFGRRSWIWEISSLSGGRLLGPIPSRRWRARRVGSLGHSQLISAPLITRQGLARQCAVSWPGICP